jgi:hypothetical protein
MRVAVLEAAVVANQRAVADYATAAILSMGASDSDGPSLIALFDAMTPALASVPATALSSVLSQVTAGLGHLCSGADPAVQLANEEPHESKQGLAVRVRQLAAAAVLTRHGCFVEGLEMAQQQDLQSRPSAGGVLAAEGLLSVGEQGAVLQHILLCPWVNPPEPSAAGELHGGAEGSLLQRCSMGRLLSALQPLCEEYRRTCASAAERVIGVAHARLLPNWLPQQVLHSRF